MWPGKTLNQRVWLYQSLATALDAGLGIEQALELASEQPHRAPVDRLSDVLRHENRIPELEGRVLRELPVIGGLIQSSGAGNYAYLLSVLLAAGVPILIYLAAAVYVAWVVITTFTSLYTAI